MRLLYLLIFISWQQVYGQMLELPIDYIVENHIREITINFIDRDSDIESFLVYNRTNSYDKSGLTTHTKEIFYPNKDTIHTAYTDNIQLGSKEVRTKYLNTDTLSKEVIFYRNHSITSLYKDTFRYNNIRTQYIS